jgi:hypothetical protein
MDMESDVVVCDWLRSHIINAVGSAGFITDKGYYPTQIALCAAELVKRGGTFRVAESLTERHYRIELNGIILTWEMLKT